MPATTSAVSGAAFAVAGGGQMIDALVIDLDARVVVCHSEEACREDTGFQAADPGRKLHSQSVGSRLAEPGLTAPTVKGLTPRGMHTEAQRRA